MTLIELCGGFTVQHAARVIEAVNGRAPVGHVNFGLESVTAAFCVCCSTWSGMALA